MNRRSDITVFPDGITPEPGVYVTVKNADGTLATLYDDAAVALGNPVLSDSNGAFFYNVADAGTYIEEFRLSPTALPRTTQVVSLGIAALVHITPEQFGAVGYPLAVDDGPALSAASAALNIIGRGVIDFFPGRTYVVGSQTFNGAVPAEVGGGVYTFAPTTVYPIHIESCTGSVILNGNGARIQCLSGKKYGSFNEDGTVGADALPYFGAGVTGKKVATPYLAMVHIKGNSGSVSVLDLELDGNISNAVLGGGWGDIGRQIPMTGIYFRDNTGPLYTRNLYAHHHGLDGGIGDGPGLFNTKESVRIHGRFINNGRQAFSLVGGNGWHFEDGCEFVGTGKNIGAMAYSPPGAGVDLEAEGGKYVVNTTFGDVKSIDNSGPAILAPAGAANTLNATFRGGKFIGTTTWSLWLERPGFRFYDSVIAGPIVNVYGSDDPNQTTQFHLCLITDSLAISPTGALYNASASYVFISGASDRVYFNECRLEKTQNGGDSTNGSVGNLTTGAGMKFHNCMFENTSNKNFIINGIYSGDRTYIKNANSIPSPLAASLFLFEAGPSLDSFLFENTLAFAYAKARYSASIDRATGKRIFFGSATYDPPSLALAAKTTIQTMTVTGVVLGDKVDEVSFSLNLAGARIQAWVSAADTVSFYFINENGANPLDLGSGTVRVKVSQS